MATARALEALGTATAGGCVRRPSPSPAPARTRRSLRSATASPADRLASRSLSRSPSACSWGGGAPSPRRGPCPWRHSSPRLEPPSRAPTALGRRSSRRAWHRRRDRPSDGAQYLRLGQAFRGEPQGHRPRIRLDRRTCGDRPAALAGRPRRPPQRHRVAVASAACQPRGCGGDIRRRPSPRPGS
jgi:hypothetical protein